MSSLTYGCFNYTLFAIKLRSSPQSFRVKKISKERLRDLNIVERVILPKGNGLQPLGFQDTMKNRRFVLKITQHLWNKRYLDCKHCKQLYGRAFCGRMRRLAREDHSKDIAVRMLKQFSNVCGECQELYYIIWIEEQSHIVICLVVDDFVHFHAQDTINDFPLTMIQNYVCPYNCLTDFCDNVRLIWNQGYI